MMLRLITTNFLGRPLWAGLLLAMVMAFGAVPAWAGDYGYGGGYSGGHYNGGGNYQGYTQTTVVQTHTNTNSNYSGRRYYYSNSYRDGGSGWSWLRYSGSRESNNGYYGPGGANNTPHRSDWYAKLAAQRRWDEQQYKQMQAKGGAECGLSGAPVYCYKLLGPYPQEIRVVRY